MVSNNNFMSTPTFSERIKQFRRSQGITQTELGSMLGVTAAYIGMLEGGREVDPESTLAKLFELHEKGATNGGRGKLKAARMAAGLSQKQLAKEIGYTIGVLQAIEDGTARISQGMAEKICAVLPTLALEELLGGSEQVGVARVEDGPSLVRPMGTKVTDIRLPEGMTVRVVPLISWAQAGAMASYGDEVYQYEGHIAFNVTDPRAFAVGLRGDSMQPNYGEGDVAILYPSEAARNGDLVVARLSEEAGGDVMFKIFTSSRKDGTVTLSSYNPAYPPMTFARTDFAWIYPVANVVKSLRK